MHGKGSFPAPAADRGSTRPNAFRLLRLAEEIATLDQLSGGRIDFGVGSGVSPYESAILGVEAANAKPVYAETLAAVTAALHTGRMTHDGKLLLTP